MYVMSCLHIIQYFQKYYIYRFIYILILVYSHVPLSGLWLEMVSGWHDAGFRHVLPPSLPPSLPPYPPSLSTSSNFHTPLLPLVPSLPPSLPPSGGNENFLCLWDASMMESVTTTAPRLCLKEHQAAVKALAWCPFQRYVPFLPPFFCLLLRPLFFNPSPS